MPEPIGEGEAAPMEQASTEPAPEADGEIKESEAPKSAESNLTPTEDGASGDDASSDDTLDPTDATMTVGADAPTAKPQLEGAAATTTVKTDAATAPNLEVKAEASAAPTAGADPEIAIAGDPTIKTEPAPQPSGAGPKQTFTPVAPVSAAPADDAQTANALPVLPGNATSAKPAPDQATLPQSNGAPAAPPPVADPLRSPPRASTCRFCSNRTHRQLPTRSQ